MIQTEKSVRCTIINLYMQQTVLFDGESDHGHYRVVDTFYDGRLARVLYGNESTPQSGLATDDDPELLFNYNQRFLEVAYSMSPSKVLVIGGGVLTLPVALAERLQIPEIDVVEIDGLLPQLARNYFGFNDQPAINVVIQDGQSFIRDCNKQYDLIVIDAFSGPAVVEALFSVQNAAHYSRCLSDSGVVVVNFISRYRTTYQTLTHQIMKNFEQSFDSIDIYPADHHESSRVEQNLVLVAARGEQPSFDYLQSVTVAVTPPREPLD